MARKLRLEYSGACYHVINRGNYRRNLIAPKGAAQAFRVCLAEAADTFGWRIHAYVIMRNHFHLALETPKPNLSHGMKWLQGTWATRFNRWHGETGRPFQGRYKSLHVESGHALAQVAHYIHLNPVRANVVPAVRVGEFRHSSLPAFSHKDRPTWLIAETVLAESGGLPDTAAGWRKYGEYLAFLAEEDAKLQEEKFGRLSRGWMLGSEEFKQALQKDLAKLGGDLEKVRLLGTVRAPELREEHWEQILRRGARALKINLNKLPAKKSATEKVQLATLLKTKSAVSNGWLATRLEMGQPASVSQFVRRFRLTKAHQDSAFQAALSNVTT
jgi:putative transposase